MSDTLTIKTNYSGSEKTRDAVKQQIEERWPKLVKDYDPYLNCMPAPQWFSRGYKILPGSKSIKSIVLIEKKDEHGEVISSYPKTVHLFYFPQVKKVRHGN